MMPRKFATSLEDAKKKRCPRDLSSTCVADLCMAWRFVRTNVDDGEGGTRPCDRPNADPMTTPARLPS